jgi:creatinine amidohydrolase
MSVFRYAELLPDQLAKRLAVCPVAIVPWGALEWHGPHLPFGLDGLVAEGFAERLAARMGGVLLPTTYLPITALPHPQSLSFASGQVMGVWAELFEALSSAGFRLVCLISGHYAQGHELALVEAAEQAMSRGRLLVLAGTPLALLNDADLLDHAGRWETSQLQALRPELVQLDLLADGPLPDPGEVAVLGQDPRLGSAEQGEDLFARALEAWAAWIERLRRTADVASLRRLYDERRTAYSTYVQRYFRESWEQAITDWWQASIDQAHARE